MSLIGTVLAEEGHTPELLALFRERIVAPRRQMIKSILLRAKQNKELRPSVNLDTAVNMLVGAFYARYLANAAVPRAFPRKLVNILWHGIARPAPPQ
jgi:hypothetical protein